MSTTTSEVPFGTTALSRVSTRVSRLKPWIPLRIPKAGHWRSDTFSEELRTRHVRIDSKFEPSTSIKPEVTQDDQPCISVLPAVVRSDIYQHILTQDCPIEPKEATTISHEATPLDHIPLILAFPTIKEEMVQHIPYFLRCNTFTFDLRIEQGLRTFQAWCATLGHHAWNVRYITLKHWTAYWGLSQNRWIALEDVTHFSYSANGDVVASRTAIVPKIEACNCRTVVPMLARFDRHLDPQQFHTLAKVQQLVACLRSREDRPERSTLVDAAKTFAAMLDVHSRLLAKMYGLAGDYCSSCSMPRLYLCGNLSTRQEADSSNLVFDSKALGVYPQV